jgi:hypothetical protein
MIHNYVIPIRSILINGDPDMKLKSVLWLIFVILLLFHMIILGTHFSLLFFQKSTPSIFIILYCILIIFSSVAFFAGMVKKNIRENKSFTSFCSVAVIIMGAGLVWFLMDAPEIKNDYVREDVVHNANGSYQYIDFFNKADIKALKKANQKLGEGYKGKVSIKAFDQVWEEIIQYRHAIDELDKFDIICDLPERAEIDMEVPFMNFSALKEVTKIYRKYFLLKLSQGKGREAAEHLCRLHRVARKGMNDATVLINKMIFNSLMIQTMDTAYIATLNTECDSKILAILTKSFVPLDSNELSLRRPMIAEYLLLKNTMQKLISPEAFLESVSMTPDDTEQENKTNTPASYFAYYFSFKPNKSLLPMKKYFDLIIEAQDVSPADFTKADTYFEEYSKQVPVSNMAGWILNTIAMPNFETYFSKFDATKVKSDLLALTLQKKLGQKSEINDIYTKKFYEYKKKNGFLLHAGKDGKYDNDDDIVLGIKPDKVN